MTGTSFTAFGCKPRHHKRPPPCQGGAKYCSSLCWQHNYRGHRPHGYVLDYVLSDVLQSAGSGSAVAGGALDKVSEPGRMTLDDSATFWKRMQDALEEARLVAAATDGTVVAASIIVMNDDAEIVREWELDC